MYLPEHFEEHDQGEIARIVEQFPLATLVCHTGADFIANPVPFFHDQGSVYIGHIAKANSLHERFAGGTDALLVFSGENSYISPNWYPSKALTHRLVPTWNYQVVQLHGRLEFDYSRKARLSVVGKLTKQYERNYSGSQQWKMSDAPMDFIDSMLENIVALSFTATKVIAKSKLSQNRQQSDFAALVKTMESNGKHALAKAMSRFGSEND